MTAKSRVTAMRSSKRHLQRIEFVEQRKRCPSSCMRDRNGERTWTCRKSVRGREDPCSTGHAATVRELVDL